MGNGFGIWFEKGDDMDIRILYIDDFLLVCEKPVGISSESPGLPDLVREQEGFTVYPAHRLDQTTGGVFVLARSSSVCAQMQKLFQQNLMSKTYLAVISGVPETDFGIFSDLLYHDRRRNKTFVVGKKRKGVKEASCEWNLEKTVNAGKEVFSLIRIRLHTGRTHQIRVQFASRQMPLVGDHRYGSRIKVPVPSLWSAQISFPHPVLKGKTVQVSSDPPDIFPWTCFSGT
jgi:23S rRNA pseudouridine1911/1915/1917 synthase